MLDQTPTDATSDLNGVFHLSSTATVSCSRGEVSITCTVNGSPSDKVDVCEYQAGSSPP